MPWRTVLVLLSSIALSGQERPTFTSQTDLVVVHATVEDRRGAAVPDLAQDNFLVYDDNRPQTISFFSSADAPASIGLLIDNSTSMISKRERVIASAARFAELSNPADEIFVLLFNEQVREVWAAREINESDISVLQATLRTHISARGQTALFDAISAGLDRLARAKHSRQVLVVVSDGSDNASRTDLARVMARVHQSMAMIYGVILEDPVDRDGNPRLLKRLSAITGGESFSPGRPDEVPPALDHIARDIRATYTIGFVPTNQAADGAMRKLRVVARHPDGRQLKVQSRTGYAGPRREPSQEK
jgi:Ca-activated chloride channel family protein